MSNLFDPRGRVIPRKPKPFRPDPNNTNFKADFHMEMGRKVIKSTPHLLTVLGSISPGMKTVEVAIELKFRDGLVISGGPLLMEIKEKDDGDGHENEADDSGVHPAGPGVDSGSAD
jgi:hypothetical protein